MSPRRSLPPFLALALLCGTVALGASRALPLAASPAAEARAPAPRSVDAAAAGAAARVATVLRPDRPFGRKLTEHDRSRRRQMIASVLLVAVLTGVAALVLRLRGTEMHRRMWLVSSVFSLLALVAMGRIWHLTVSHVGEGLCPGTRVDSPAAVADFLRHHSGASARDGVEARPVYVPTGIFLQSIQFSSAYDVTVTGYVWQRYGKDVPDSISRGFVLPEGDLAEVEEAYRRPDPEGGEVIGWYFKTTLRQTFFYSQYPFDRQDVWIRLWHKDFDRNVVLVPDLGAYRATGFEDRAGLEHDFVLESWEVEGTCFTYRLNSYATNFGIRAYQGQHSFPEVYYNVTLRRNFLDAFIAYMIPPLVVAIMVFAVLVLVTKDAERASAYGFNTSTVLAYCASLFFIVIFSQVSLRNALAAQGVVYLEYFYFYLYLALLLVSTNFILFSSSVRVRFIDWEENFLPKVLYWPILLGALLATTFYTFF